MSIFLRFFVMGGLARLVLRTVWAQLRLPRAQWLDITVRQRIGFLLIGLLHLLFALPSLIVCGVGVWVITSNMEAFASSISFVVIDVIMLVILFGSAQLAVTQLATCVLDLVIAWRGSKPPTDLGAVIAASNWIDVR